MIETSPKNDFMHGEAHEITLVEYVYGYMVRYPHGGQNGRHGQASEGE